jgi:Flp pilus assembly protein TadG
MDAIGRSGEIGRDESGEIVEAVVVFPVFLILLLTMFQLAFLMLGHEDAQAASQYGAQVAASSGNPEEGVVAGQQVLSTLGGTMISASSVTNAGSTPTLDVVNSMVTVQSIVPLPGLHLSASAISVASSQKLGPAGQ